MWGIVGPPSTNLMVKPTIVEPLSKVKDLMFPGEQPRPPSGLSKRAESSLRHRRCWKSAVLKLSGLLLSLS